VAGLTIVGASQAGLQLACSLRELGWREPVTLVGAESHPPYARPPLSKAFLTASGHPSGLAFRDERFYSALDIELILGETVEKVEIEAGRALLCSGRELAFDRLALATGARPRPLPIPGAELDGVLVLRGLDDALALRARLAASPDVVVIGGGFVGLEVAGTAAALGSRTTVLELGPALMGRAVSAPTAAFVQTFHAERGVAVRTGTRPVRVLGADGRVTGVELAGGEVVPAGVVVVGIGVAPADELARSAGLDCDNGIVVDEFSRASDGVTLAVGDCANIPDPSPVEGPRARLRLESVDNAVEQARAAATTVVGAARPYRGVPWFWSDQAGAKLQIAGLATPADEAVVRPGRAGRQVVLRYRGAVLVAAECVNSPAEFLSARKALAAGRGLARERAEEPGSLKDLLAAR